MRKKVEQKKTEETKVRAQERSRAAAVVLFNVLGCRLTY